LRSRVYGSMCVWVYGFTGLWVYGSMNGQEDKGPIKIGQTIRLAFKIWIIFYFKKHYAYFYPFSTPFTLKVFLGRKNDYCGSECESEKMIDLNFAKFDMKSNTSNFSKIQQLLLKGISINQRWRGLLAWPLSKWQKRVLFWCMMV